MREKWPGWQREFVYARAPSNPTARRARGQKEPRFEAGAAQTKKARNACEPFFCLMVELSGIEPLTSTMPS
jgi:hypothetical protein